MTRTTGATTTASLLVRLRWGLATAMALLVAGTAHAADADGLSNEDKACLECHAKPGLAKALPNGEKLSLHVRAKVFAESVHGSEGCEACHAEIDLATHGKETKPLASKREQSRALNEACTDCHAKTVKQYADSVHAALVQQGSAKAPLCSDCHNPHALQPMKKAAARGEPATCAKCHDDVTKAYAASVHGAAGDEALACKDCHRSHSVKAASLGTHLRDECLSCHSDVATTHASWLPKADRHLDAVSCAACHAPGAKRRVDLRFYDGTAQWQATDKVGVPQFKKITSASDGRGLDSRALWSLLQEFNRNGAESKMVLRGRLDVRTGVEAHQLGAKALAVSNCATCHRDGAEAFQSVTVSLAGPDGRPLRHEAGKDVLSSVESIESIGGFYMIGATRIKLLDTLLVLTLAAGIALPGAHLTVKWLSKRARDKRAAAGPQ